MTITHDPIETTRAHGRYATYSEGGCRCYPCSQAKSQYEIRRVRAIAAGRWNPWVPIEQVRPHVEMLRNYGMGYRTIAEVSGVHRTTVQEIAEGCMRTRASRQRIRRDVADKLLAVQPEERHIAGAVLVDGTGVRRRTQALCALGWPLKRQAALAGMQYQFYAKLTYTPQVQMRTLRRVRTVYETLAMQTPPPSGYVTRTKRRAASMGWKPPLCWEDEALDDPTARPLREALRKSWRR